MAVVVAHNHKRLHRGREGTDSSATRSHCGGAAFEKKKVRKTKKKEVEKVKRERDQGGEREFEAMRASPGAAARLGALLGRGAIRQTSQCQPARRGPKPSSCSTEAHAGKS
jgi:hypothetical protein